MTFKIKGEIKNCKSIEALFYPHLMDLLVCILNLLLNYSKYALKSCIRTAITSQPSIPHTTINHASPHFRLVVHNGAPQVNGGCRVPPVQGSRYDGRVAGESKVVGSWQRCLLCAFVAAGGF